MVSRHAVTLCGIYSGMVLVYSVAPYLGLLLAVQTVNQHNKLSKPYTVLLLWDKTCTSHDINPIQQTAACLALCAWSDMCPRGVLWTLVVSHMHVSLCCIYAVGSNTVSCCPLVVSCHCQFITAVWDVRGCVIAQKASCIAADNTEWKHEYQLIRQLLG